MKNPLDPHPSIMLLNGRNGQIYETFVNNEQSDPKADSDLSLLSKERKELKQSNGIKHTFFYLRQGQINTNKIHSMAISCPRVVRASLQSL